MPVKDTCQLIVTVYSATGKEIDNIRGDFYVIPDEGRRHFFIQSVQRLLAFYAHRYKGLAYFDQEWINEQSEDGMARIEEGSFKELPDPATLKGYFYHAFRIGNEGRDAAFPSKKKSRLDESLKEVNNGQADINPSKQELEVT